MFGWPPVLGGELGRPRPARERTHGKNEFIWGHAEFKVPGETARREYLIDLKN